MKTLAAAVLFFCATSAAWGYVSVEVYESDGNTPFDSRDIMVGTRLTIVLDSNVGEYWVGDIAITGDNINYGMLFGRGYDSNTTDWAGSRFPAAGTDARVWDWKESEPTDVNGFSFNGDDYATTGRWFIIDYNATDVGNCTVEFFENFNPDPNRDISFVQILTRDFNKDTIVNFGDFAALASYWRKTDCGAPGWCEGTDLDTSGTVDCNDLGLFVDYWLEKTWYP